MKNTCSNAHSMRETYFAGVHERITHARVVNWHHHVEELDSSTHRVSVSILTLRVIFARC